MNERIAQSRELQQRIELGDFAAMQEFESICQPTLMRIVQRAMVSQSHSTALRMLIDHELRLAAASPQDNSCGDPQRALGNVAVRIAQLLMEKMLPHQSRNNQNCADGIQFNERALDAARKSTRTFSGDQSAKSACEKS